MKEQDIEKKPAWLKRMENGSIAEARTRAFLMDRFWILERSVDVQGADFIIQRRLTSKNLLDDDPPRFGVIQTKFMQDEKTMQHIHEEYVVNQEGQPRGEFFLIIHNGVEDNRRQFLLSAKDIKESFSVQEYGEVKKFVIRGKDILPNSKYEIMAPSQALNRIEQSIRLADFAKNRKFVSWTLPSYSDFSPDDINDEFPVPLDNWWGDIPEAFYQTKKKVEELLYEMLVITDPLQEVLETTDPLVAPNILEGLEFEMVRISSGYGFYFHADIYNQDFHYVVNQHREKIDYLREKGFLDRFLVIQKKVDEFVRSDLAPKMKLEPSLAYTINVTYDPINLAQYIFRSSIIPRDQFHVSSNISADDYYGVIESIPGNITVFFMPGRLHYKEEDSRNWGKEIRDKVWMVRRPLMEEIFIHIDGG